MKKSPNLEERKDFAERKAFCSKCLAKNIKLSSFLGGNPIYLLIFIIFIVNLTLLNYVCSRFTF